MFDPSGPGAKQRAEMLKSVTKLVKSSVEGLASDIKAIDDTVRSPTPTERKRGKGKRDADKKICYVGNRTNWGS